MKKLMLAAIAAVSCAEIRADLNVSGYGSFDVSSAYVLYGGRQNKEPCYWTYGELDLNADAWGTVGASLWQNTDMTCRRKESMRRMNEWDWAGYYRNGIDLAEGWRLSGEVGHIWYKYHGLTQSGRSAYKTMMEVYGRLELNNPYLTPYFAIFHDWKVTEGTFMLAGLKRDFTLPLDLVFTPDFTVGGGDRRYLDCLYPPWGYGNVKGGISYVQLSGKLAYWFNENFGVHALVAYSVIANDKIRYGIDADGSDYRKQFVWGNVGIDVAF